MKRILIFAMFILFPVLACAQPSIVFDNERYDFGTVSNVDTIEHIFEFTNAGDQELVIDKLSPSWGCTAVMVSSSHLKPGEKGKISAKIDIKGRKGSISKGIRVFSNDPKRTGIDLSVKAIIK